MDIISGDATLSVAKDPAPYVVAETPVGAEVELFCTKCSKLAKSVRKLQKDNSYLRKRSRELKDQLKTDSCCFHIIVILHACNIQELIAYLYIFLLFLPPWRIHILVVRLQ